VNVLRWHVALDEKKDSPALEIFGHIGDQDGVPRESTLDEDIAREHGSGICYSFHFSSQGI
jgi:hypothetical protein